MSSYGSITYRLLYNFEYKHKHTHARAQRERERERRVLLFCFYCLSICEKFNVAKALQSVRRITRILVKFASICITWLKDDRVQQVFEEFETISGFSFDGTYKC